MMHEGDKYHESVGDGDGDDTLDVMDVTAAAAMDRANDQREPRKFFPRVKMLLSFDYEPVRHVNMYRIFLSSWSGTILSTLATLRSKTIRTRMD
jgi:hypothetical protein